MIEVSSQRAGEASAPNQMGAGHGQPSRHDEDGKNSEKSRVYDRRAGQLEPSLARQTGGGDEVEEPVLAQESAGRPRGGGRRLASEEHPGHREDTPAEGPPDLVARLRLGRIIRRRPADRMQPDDETAPRDLGKHRLKTRIVERGAAHMGAELKADRSHCVSSADLGKRRVDVVQRQCRGEGREAIGMASHQFGEPVIHQAHQIDSSLAIGEVLDRGHRGRQ